jgi:hypothetical protein
VTTTSKNPIEYLISSVVTVSAVCSIPKNDHSPLRTKVGGRLDSPIRKVTAMVAFISYV